MEVWALEAYAASNILQEMITIKSDDVAGRTQAYEAIVKSAPIKKPNIPESFNVLIKELQAIGLDVGLLDNEELEYTEAEAASRYEKIIELEHKAASADGESEKQAEKAPEVEEVASEEMTQAETSETEESTE